MSAQNRGIVKIAPGKAILTSVPIPKLQDDYILIKTIAVALNPTDWQTCDEPFKIGTKRSLLGCDAAGVVIEVGKKVTKNLKKGDWVAGMTHGGDNDNEEHGTFAEYITVKGDLTIRIPPHLSFDEASTLPCGISTVGLGLYRYLETPFLTWPLQETKNEGPLLIYGGSSATGTLAIQFAKLSGYTVITTASPRNFELLQSLGADHVLDYHDPNCGEKIRTLTDNKLRKVFDTIATPSTAKICAAAMSSSPGGLYVNLMGITDFPREDVRNIFFLGYTALNEEFEIEGEVWPVVPEDFELVKNFCNLTDRLLEQGKIKTHPASVRLGIKGILDGMQELKEGKVSGAKLVYRIGEVDTGR